MTASPSAMLSKLKSLPGLAPTGSSPPAEALLSPLQIWIQSAEQWQKFWAQAMTPWSDYRKLF
jgi:hypothetical protein